MKKHYEVENPSREEINFMYFLKLKQKQFLEKLSKIDNFSEMKTLINEAYLYQFNPKEITSVPKSKWKTKISETEYEISIYTQFQLLYLRKLTYFDSILIDWDTIFNFYLETPENKKMLKHYILKQKLKY